MPIYEYQCLDCHQNFEKLVLPSQKEPIACPHCRSCHVDKQLSVFGAKFSKGKGILSQSRSSSSTACSSCSSRNCSTCK